ncbi:MAG: prepilin-type N-terminal cleavage/methylation domain-containing protein [Candidatus Taylorbacteria bacterium]
MKQVKQISGFSLVETLVYIAIFSVLIISITNFFGTMSASRIRNQLTLEVNDQGAKVMKTITQALRNASQVNSPTIGNTGASLSLVTVAPVTSPTVFSLSNGTIFVTEGAGVATALTNNKVIANSLVFANLSHPSTPNIVKISYTLTSSTTASGPGGQYSFTFNGSGALRK